MAPSRQKDWRLHRPHRLFDVARIAADDQRDEILHRADDRMGLPFQRRLAPAVKAGLSVSTLTNTQLRISAFTTRVVTAVIFNAISLGLFVS